MRGVIAFVWSNGRGMHLGVLFQLVEHRRPLQIFAGGSMCWINRLTPCGGIFLVDQLSDGNFGKVGISHKFGAVEKSAPESFYSEMDGLGRPVFQFCEIVAFENIQR